MLCRVCGWSFDLSNLDWVFAIKVITEVGGEQVEERLAFLGSQRGGWMEFGGKRGNGPPACGRLHDVAAEASDALVLLLLLLFDIGCG